MLSVSLASLVIFRPQIKNTIKDKLIKAFFTGGKKTKTLIAIDWHVAQGRKRGGGGNPLHPTLSSIITGGGSALYDVFSVIKTLKPLLLSK